MSVLIFSRVTGWGKGLIGFEYPGVMVGWSTHGLAFERRGDATVASRPDGRSAWAVAGPAQAFFDIAMGGDPGRRPEWN